MIRGLIHEQYTTGNNTALSESRYFLDCCVSLSSSEGRLAHLGVSEGVQATKKHDWEGLWVEHHPCLSGATVRPGRLSQGSFGINGSFVTLSRPWSDVGSRAARIAPAVIQLSDPCARVVLRMQARLLWGSVRGGAARCAGLASRWCAAPRPSAALFSSRHRFLPNQEMQA